MNSRMAVTRRTGAIQRRNETAWMMPPSTSATTARTPTIQINLFIGLAIHRAVYSLTGGVPGNCPGAVASLVASVVPSPADPWPPAAARDTGTFRLGAAS
jgi:hypothetical protein